MRSSGSELVREWLSVRTLVIVSPLFLLTVRGWTNGIVFVAFLGAVFFLLRHRNDALDMSATTRRWRRRIGWTLAAPFLAVAIAQWLRHDFHGPNLDVPLRLVLCVAVFMAISRGWLIHPDRTPITRIWGTSVFPLTLLWTLLDKPSWTTSWGADRITTYFVDPLTFGSLCLLLSLLGFAALSFFWQGMRPASRLIGASGVLAGLYLAAMSGSRTGWANLPVFFSIWTIFFASQKYGRRKALLIVLLGTLLVTGAISLQPTLAYKIRHAFEEISHYHWSGMNVDDSVTMRISFYRMALFYFLESPLAGWGDLGWMARMNAPELMVYASEYTRAFPQAGFHNEILTSAVRSGIWGLISSLALFGVPIAWAIRQIRRPIDSDARQMGLLLLFFMLHLLIAGMTTEVTNLVFLSSFIGLTLAVMLGESVYRSRGA